MQSFQSKSHGTFAPRRGFTLVEMLVVVAIVSILMTLATIGLNGMAGKGVSSAVSSVESLFDEARTMAVGRNIRAAVLISQTLTNNPEEDLRRVLVVHEEVDPATGEPTNPTSATPNWVIASRATLLPDKTFFSARLSKQQNGSGIPTITDAKLVGAKSSQQGSYYIYEFNSQGISAVPGANFIVGNGTRNTTDPASASPPRVTGEGKRDFGGFVVWRNGRTSVYRSPEQMDLPTPITEF